MDLLEALNRGAVELADATLELVHSDGCRGNRDMLEPTEQVHELQVDPTNVLRLNAL